jgi:hypothetical protein
MLVRVAPLFEDGKPFPRHRAVTAQPAHTGKLSLAEQYDADFRRTILFARLCERSTGVDVLPRLYDAVVRWIGEGCMTINGFEREPATQECMAQSWYVQIVVEAGAGRD